MFWISFIHSFNSSTVWKFWERSINSEKRALTHQPPLETPAPSFGEKFGSSWFQGSL
jgi:hypothetical protein